MNFTREIKREIMRSAPEKRCCGCAFLVGVLDASGKIAPDGFSVTSESEEIAGFVLAHTERLFNVTLSVTEAVRDPKHGRDKLTFSRFGEDMVEKVSELLKGRPGERLKACCAENYLKGAFLGGGSCTLPRGGTKTGYHLEVVFNEEDRAERFCELLDRFQIIGNIVSRKEKRVVYIKSREAICDFLAIVGAEGALRKLEAVSAAREERNNENRKGNCYAGNADRAAIASADQVLALQKMQKEGKFASLSEPLKETATARLLNPELSLKELAEKLNISKSCLFHRLKKLMTLV